jgi:hypothetical protein
MATATAERRWPGVGVGKSPSYEDEVLVSVVGGVDEEKNEVGRAIRRTPNSEIREAYLADRGKGSRRNK